MSVTDSLFPARARRLMVGLLFGVFMVLSAMPADAQFEAVSDAVVVAPIGPASEEPETASFETQLQALQVQIAILEQRLQAHRNLVDRNQMNSNMQLGNRIDALENQVSGAAAASPLGAIQQNAGTASKQDQLAAQARSRMNDIEDTLRLLRGQVDTMLVQFNAFSQRQQNANQDNEFRFQQLEAQLERLKNGGVSLSEEPQVLGRIKRPAVDLPTTPVVIGEADGTTKLVGEGDMPVAGESGVAPRPALNDAQKIYDRALAALRQGSYSDAEADLVQMLNEFPSHELAGHAQYWLGETYYVRQDYKRAAQAFLAGYTKYAKSPKAPDSLLKLGITLIAIEERKTGCDAFAELEAKFPDAPQAIIKRAEIEKRRARCDG